MGHWVRLWNKQQSGMSQILITMSSKTPCFCPDGAAAAVHEEQIASRCRRQQQQAAEVGGAAQSVPRCSRGESASRPA